METAVLIAGGNLGDVRGALAEALEMTRAAGEIKAVSGIYESAPWGFDAQERFLNQVWVLETPLGPEELLDSLQETEMALGRTAKTAGGGYASRTMDIDILFYGDRVIDTPRLRIPHPLMAQRRFVLEPLAETCAGMIHPVSGKSVEQLLDEL